jgi:hypothetical protein
VIFVSFLAAEREAGQLEDGEDIGVTEFVGQGDAEDIELIEWAARFKAGERELSGAELVFHVPVGAVRSFRQAVVSVVKNMVEDLQSLMGHANFVKIWKNQGETCRGLFPDPWSAVEFLTEIATGMIDCGVEALVAHGIGLGLLRESFGGRILARLVGVVGFEPPNPLPIIG